MDLNIIPLISSFVLIALAELGDKTQITTITLSARYRALSVFIGAMLAVALIDGVGVAVGTALGNILPMNLISIISALIFILFGIYSLKSRDNVKARETNGKPAILTSFSMISLMELGDKTQLTVIALAARFHAPIQVFTGAMLAFMLLMGMGVLIGSRLLKRLPDRYLRIVSSAVFLLFGVIFLINAII